MAHEISVQQLATMQASGQSLYLLDVRQPEEYDIVALANSTLIPLPELAQRQAEIQPPAGAAMIVYCHHGIRSRLAADFLGQCGFAPVFSLAGGIDAWSRLIDRQVPRY